MACFPPHKKRREGPGLLLSIATVHPIVFVAVARLRGGGGTGTFGAARRRLHEAILVLFRRGGTTTTELSVAFAAAGRRRKTIVRVVLRGRTPDTGIPAALVATERRHNCFEPELPRLGGNPGKAQLCLLTIKHKTSFSTDYLRNNQGRLVHEEAPPI